MSVGLQLYSEWKKCNLHHLVTKSLFIHIETSHLVDDTYELVPTNENESASAQVNSLELIQDPNQSLEEAKASSAQEGKPWCI